MLRNADPDEPFYQSNGSADYASPRTSDGQVTCLPRMVIVPCYIKRLLPDNLPLTYSRSDASLKIIADPACACSPG